MKTRIYVRVGRQPRGKAKVTATAVKPSNEPLFVVSKAIPTVAFALDIDIPDDAFKRAEKVLAEIDIPEPDLAADVKVVR